LSFPSLAGCIMLISARLEPAETGWMDKVAGTALQQRLRHAIREETAKPAPRGVGHDHEVIVVTARVPRELVGRRPFELRCHHG